MPEINTSSWQPIGETSNIRYYEIEPQIIGSRGDRAGGNSRKRRVVWVSKQNVELGFTDTARKLAEHFVLRLGQLHLFRWRRTPDATRCEKTQHEYHEASPHDIHAGNFSPDAH